MKPSAKLRGVLAGASIAGAVIATTVAISVHGTDQATRPAGTAASPAAPTPSNTSGSPQPTVASSDLIAAKNADRQAADAKYPSTPTADPVPNEIVDMSAEAAPLPPSMFKASNVWKGNFGGRNIHVYAGYAGYDNLADGVAIVQVSDSNGFETETTYQVKTPGEGALRVLSYSPGAVVFRTAAGNTHVLHLGPGALQGVFK